jgi:hypothetical protein
MAIQKRHYDLGPSKFRGPGYRIDDTSIDGSGLVPDDGDSRRERGFMDVGPVSNADVRSSYTGQTAKFAADRRYDNGKTWWK